MGEAASEVRGGRTRCPQDRAALPSRHRGTAPTAARVAPRATRSATAAAWSSAYKSRCSRFFALVCFASFIVHRNEEERRPTPIRGPHFDTGRVRLHQMPIERLRPPPRERYRISRIDGQGLPDDHHEDRPYPRPLTWTATPSGPHRRAHVVTGRHGTTRRTRSRGAPVVLRPRRSRLWHARTSSRSPRRSAPTRSGDTGGVDGLPLPSGQQCHELGGVTQRVEWRDLRRVRQSAMEGVASVVGADLGQGASEGVPADQLS